MQWEDTLSGDFSVEIKIVAEDKAGILAEVSAVIAEYSTNIESIKSDPPSGNKVDLYILLAVTDRDHLAKILRRLRRKDFVILATRIHSWEQRNATLPIIDEEISEDS